MTSTFKRLALMFGICSWCATPMIGAGLSQLLSMASAVVKGSVTSRIEGPRQVEFTINVEQVISGTVPGPTIHVHNNWASLLRFSGEGSNVATLTDYYEGIWFLTGTPAGGWDVIVSRPSAARTMLSLFLPSAGTAITGTTSLLDWLVQTVSAAASNTLDGAGVLRGALDGVDSPVTRQVLQAAAASSDVGLVAEGLSGLIQRQDETALGSVKYFV